MFVGKGKSWLMVSCSASSILEQKLWMLMQRLSLLQSFSKLRRFSRFFLDHLWNEEDGKDAVNQRCFYQQILSSAFDVIKLFLFNEQNMSPDGIELFLFKAVVGIRVALQWISCGFHGTPYCDLHLHLLCFVPLQMFSVWEYFLEDWKAVVGIRVSFLVSFMVQHDVIVLALLCFVSCQVSVVFSSCKLSTHDCLLPQGQYASSLCQF